MNSIILKRALAQRQALMMRGATAYTTRAFKPGGEVYRNYESTTITDQRRFDDEPEPTEDDQISKFTKQFIPIAVENLTSLSIH